MTYPTGVQLATLTFSNPTTFLGNSATRTEMTVHTSAGVVWAATGEPIDDFDETVAPAPGMPGSLTVPFVDQPGFTDQAGNNFTMWAYTVTRRTVFGNSAKTVTKHWQPVLGQSEAIDFDQLPGGTIGLPVSAPIVPVTSVAGETGVVGAESLAGALVEFLPDGVTPETVEANLPTYLAVEELDATIASAVSPKLDAATAATSYAAKSAETSKLDKTEAVGTYGRLSGARPGNLVVFLGDSTVRGVTNDAPIAGTTAVFIGDSWPTFASMVSGQRIRYVKNAGISGDTTTGMLARFDADVAAYNPNAVTILAGRNDLGMAAATYYANIEALVAKVRGIGAVPILCTMLPTSSTDSSRQLVVSRNKWIRRYAAKQGIALVDFYNQAVDPATGAFLASYGATDLTHPGPNGYRLMGEYAASVIAPLLPAYSPPIAVDQADTDNLLGAGMFLGTVAAGTVAPWSPSASPAGAVFSVVNDPLVPGNMQRTVATGTAGDANIRQIVNVGATMAIGDKLAITGVITNTTSGGNVTVRAYFTGAPIGPQKDIFVTSQPITRGRFYYEVTVPDGATAMQILLMRNAGTGTVDFGQMSVYNLTKLGLA